MIADILKAINSPNGDWNLFVLFDARDLKDADMICKGVFYSWSEVMGYICGRAKGATTYTIEQVVSKYYVTVSVYYDPANADADILRGSVPQRLIGKYRIYIYGRDDRIEKERKYSGSEPV